MHANGKHVVKLLVNGNAVADNSKIDESNSHLNQLFHITSNKCCSGISSFFLYTGYITHALNHSRVEQITGESLVVAFHFTTVKFEKEIYVIN